MPSSTSNSSADYWVRPMAERVAPAIAWWRAAFFAMIAITLSVAAWEWSMRQAGLRTNDLGDSNAQWAREWRRAHSGEGKAVIVGSSRLLFDLDPELWGRLTGVRPIQLAKEGINPRPILTDLAADPTFNGLVIFGYDPRPFFRSASDGEALVRSATTEPLFKQTGLPIHDALSRAFAFIDPRMAPMGWIERVPVPQRTKTGLFNYPWKLAESGPQRNTSMWPRVETDAAYRSRASAIWLLPPPGTKPPTQKDFDTAVSQVARDVARIRARGGEVVLIRSPSDPPLLTQEDRRFPRSTTWDRLVSNTGAIGIYWQDDPVLAKMRTVELSHLSKADRDPYTRRIVELLNHALAKRGQNIAGLGATSVRPSSR